MTKVSAGVKKPKRTLPDPGKEVEELRDKVRELEETLDAIRSGEVDAIIVAKGDAQQIYTLEGADHPYQILVENIQEGVLTLSRSGMILYTNTRFAEMVKLPQEELPGTSFFDYICPEHCLEIEDAMREIQGRDFKSRARIRQGSSSLSVLITMASLSQDENTMIGVVITDRSYDEKQIFFQAKMLDAVGDAVVAVDADQKIFYWNDAATKTYGWKQNEVLGRNFVELTESKVSEKEIQVITKLLEKGEIWSGEYIVRHRDGHWFPVFANSAPVFDDNKKLIAVINVSHDITERKGAEEKLRTSYEFTSTILESIGGNLITLDKNWHFTYINQRAAIPDIFPEDLIGKSIWEVFPEIIGTPLETLYREVMASRKPTVYENKSSVAHGRYFELHMYPVGDSGLAIFGQDITERKEAELALREAQERTITILEGIADTYYSLDTRWCFTTVNPAAEKAPFGRPATELLGKVIWDLYPALVGTRIHQHYLDAAEKHTLEHYEAQSPLNGLWYDVFMQGREGGVDVYMRDITERREAEEALRESERRYKELVESANSIIIKMDKEGKISFVNEFAQNYFGYSLNELLGQDVRILIPEEEGSSGRRLEEMTNSILRNPDDFADNINENVRKNGERVWISWRNRAIRDSYGNVIGNLAIGQDITERRKAEEALRYSEENLLQAQELLEAVTKGTDVIIAVQDTNFRYIYFNQPYKEEIKRLTGKDLTIGLSMIEVFAGIPEEQKMSLNEWDKVLNGENVNQTIAFGSPGSMHYRVYHVLHTPIRDANGTIIAAGEVAYDVTRQAQVEESLRETKEYLDNLITYANAPIIVWDPQFRITLFNHAFEHLTGRKAKEVLGKQLDILLPDAYLTTAMDLISKTMEGERWDTVEIPILHKKGGIRTVLWNSASIFGSDGKTIVSTIAQGQDITDRKKIESEYKMRASEYAKMNITLKEEIRQRELTDTNLKRTLSLLNASLESTADGILVVDMQGRITGYNQNFMNMWNIPKNLLESGENKAAIKHVLPQLKNPEEYLDSIQELEEHPARESFDMIEFNDGKIFERYSKPQQIGDSVVGRVWSFRDITDRKHAEEKLVGSLLEKEVLLREIHHRVKNNLQLISGLLDMTRMRTVDESTNSILTDMMLKIQTMAQIHTRLYESKQFGRINISAQFIDQVTALSNIYSHKGHEISCEIHSEEVFLPVDQAIPCALVVNEILSNAYKHAFKGRKKGTIEISAVQENGQIHLIVRDNGVGMPDNFDVSRSSSLGLKLIRTLVEHQLKGSLMINSRQGTEIIVEFPLMIVET